MLVILEELDGSKRDFDVMEATDDPFWVNNIKYEYTGKVTEAKRVYKEQEPEEEV